MPANNSPKGRVADPPFSLTQAVKDEARRLGFQLVGITNADPPPHFETYQNWVATELHGEMAYLQTDRAHERRANPRLILPECETIIALGIRYPAPHSSSKPITDFSGAIPSPRGRVASYAWGDDYHLIIPPRLKDLVQFIENQVGHPIPNRYYTDTGPILERDLAQRAGLGWIGKNTCLIHPQKGSYFFLAEILLGIRLEPDPPFTTDHCGSCTRCLDACPTQCILPNRTLDATRCISYLTIELKSEIPLDLRSRIGNWVFGCDICQEVCPWNIRFATEDGDPAFTSTTSDIDLHAELDLTPELFNQKFKNSPVKRTKRRGYLRNVATALGNVGDPSSIPPLTEALNDPEPLIRTHSAWALGQIGGPSARDALSEALRKETDLATLAEINLALSQL